MLYRGERTRTLTFEEAVHTMGALASRTGFHVPFPVLSMACVCIGKDPTT